MATPQLSPGVLIREVDLTVGRADNVLDNIGAIAGPFAKGPVNEPIDIATENDLINVFGKPLSSDAQYEYWMSASSFLSYGGVLKVVRTDGTTLNNANAGIGSTSYMVKIKNFEDYEQNHSDDIADYAFAAKNPGSWANNLKVCVIDNKADQVLGITTTDLSAKGVAVGYGVTLDIAGATVPGNGVTETLTNGYLLKGIVTGVTTAASGNSTIDVKIFSRVSAAGTETQIEYKELDLASSFNVADTITFTNNSGIATTQVTGTATVASAVDWYNQQTLGLSNGTVYWSSLAPKPRTTSYASQRNSRNDEIHVVIVDDFGSVTGIQGNILEKHLGLSKASDAISAVNSPQSIFWKKYLALNSAYVYAGDNPSIGSDSFNNTTPTATGFVIGSGSGTGFNQITESDGQWNVATQGKIFSGIGKVAYTLAGGRNYSETGGMPATLAQLQQAYQLFATKDEIAVDYLIMGPGLTDKFESQAKANYLISIAENRKDCVACVGPHRADVVNVTNTTTQTENLVEFFAPLSSSSYAVFDSGYKYTYDRFNDTFRYIPCNGDVAGLMTRTNIVAFPWFSPAGQQRGILNNAIKLAYNPSRAQRDQLYPLRVNSIINQPGVGILLYGDKTALAYASAFDRINVRRLFLTIEQALQRSADAQLFELNDQITRSNFVNIVEPYLRDVQAKRGIYDFLVVCDETNNTPDVIDNNEFRADIYIKPAKSINYVTLTFVATRTGVSFAEVAGTV